MSISNEANANFETIEQKDHFTFSQLTLVASVAVLLLGITWMKQPQFFTVFKSNSQNISKAQLPRYYAYSPPSELTEPLVAGASTENQGPMVINEDGSLSPVLDSGKVLGALIGNEQLDLGSITVKTIPDSDGAIQEYFSKTSTIENNRLNDVEFENALTSGNQAQINKEAETLLGIKNELMGTQVPESLAKLHKLKIIQYQAGIDILNNFTKTDENPELVGQYLGRFLKAQQDLDAENSAVTKKFNLNQINLNKNNAE